LINYKQDIKIGWNFFEKVFKAEENSHTQ
jgi:hypothetical protein